MGDVNEEIDNAILSVVDSKWLKQAYVILMVIERQPPDSGWNDRQVSERIQFLFASGKIEAAGNLAKMGFSEIRKATVA